jgi:hypothetical protein
VDFAKTWRLCRLRYGKVTKPLRELPELQKMDHRSSRKKQDGECWQFSPLFVRPWHIAAASA